MKKRLIYFGAWLLLSRPVSVVMRSPNGDHIAFQAARTAGISPLVTTRANAIVQGFI